MKRGLMLEYIYAFLGTTSSEALVIIRVENPEKAKAVIRQAGINILEGKTVYAL